MIPLKKPKVKEVDIAAALGDYLAVRGYEIYPEFGEVDLTAYHRGRDELIGVQAKRELNFSVLAQARRSKMVTGHDAIWVCTGASAISLFWAPRICMHPDVDLGVVVVDRAGEGYARLGFHPSVELSYLPVPKAEHHHHRRKHMLELMCPEAQVYAAPGSTGPLQFTEFRKLEVLLYRAAEASGGQLSETETRKICGKKWRRQRFLELMANKAFQTLRLRDDGSLETYRVWGSQAAGHFGREWPLADPGLAAVPLRGLHCGAQAPV